MLNRRATRTAQARRSRPQALVILARSSLPNYRFRRAFSSRCVRQTTLQGIRKQQGAQNDSGNSYADCYYAKIGVV